MISAAIAKRLDSVEAAVDALAPKPRPGSYAAFALEHPWIEWLTFDELTELEQLYRAAEEAGAMEPAAEARAMAIAYAAEARRRAEGPRSAAAAIRHPGQLRAGEARGGAEVAMKREAEGRLG